MFTCLGIQVLLPKSPPFSSTFHHTFPQPSPSPSKSETGQNRRHYGKTPFAFKSADPSPDRALKNRAGHLPQLLPEYEKVSSIVDGPRRDPLGPISKLVEAVVDVPDELPADGKLSLDVGREEVLAGRTARPWVTGREWLFGDDTYQHGKAAQQQSSS